MSAILVCAGPHGSLGVVWIGVKAGLMYRDERGNIQMSMAAVIFGVLVLVVGLILSDLIIGQVGKAAASLGAPTYSDVDHDSATSINGLLVILYYIVLITLALGMVGGGGYGAYRSVRGGMGGM